MTARDAESRPATETQKLSEGLGRRLRAIRVSQRLSQDDLAQRARQWGLQWSKATVAGRELGQRDFSAEDLLVLPAVLGVRMADLLSDQVEVRIGDADYALGEGSLLHDIAAGQVPRSASEMLPPSERYLAQLAARRGPQVERIYPEARTVPNFTAFLTVAERHASNEAERGAARELDLDPFEVALLAMKLWAGRTLTIERNRRAEEALDPTADMGEVQARRGVATRALIQEMRDHLKEHPELRSRPETRTRGTRP